MSQQDVEIVRAWFEAWNSGEPIPEVMERFLTEDAVWETPPDLPDSEVCHGREAIIEMLSSLTAAIGRFRIGIREMRDAEGTVLVAFDVRGEGSSGGVPVEVPVVHLHELRDGRLSRVRAFLDRERAFAALDRGD